jgi:hypothetical protein
MKNMFTRGQIEQNYTSIDNNGLFEVQWCQLHERYHHNWSFPNILCQHQGIMGLRAKPGESTGGPHASLVRNSKT